MQPDREHELFELRTYLFAHGWISIGLALFCATFLFAASFFGWIVVATFLLMTAYAAACGATMLVARRKLIARDPAAPKFVRWSGLLALPSTIILGVVAIRLFNNITTDPWAMVALPIFILAHTSGILLCRTARSSKLDTALWGEAGDDLDVALNFVEDDGEVALDFAEEDVTEHASVSENS